MPQEPLSMGRLHLMILDNVFGVRDVVNSHTDMATALTRVTDERDPPEIKFECSRASVIFSSDV